MTSTATNPRDPISRRRAGRALNDEARAAQLRAANINPRTGLATDYLNHFNEAIMLLEMIPDMPECAEDFLDWQPLSYREHFTASNFKARDLAIAAYESADAGIRAEFDNITSAMTSILTAVGAAMREGQAGQDPRHAGRTGHRLGQAAGDAGRRHHQWPRRRGRCRLHHDALMSPGSPVPAAASPARRQRGDLSRRQDPAGAARALAGQGLLFAAGRPGRIRRNAARRPASRGRRGNRAEDRDRRSRRMARGGAGNRRRRPLSDHVIRGALDRPASRS